MKQIQLTVHKRIRSSIWNFCVSNFNPFHIFLLSLQIMAKTISEMKPKPEEQVLHMKLLCIQIQSMWGVQNQRGVCTIFTALSYGKCCTGVSFLYWTVQVAKGKSTIWRVGPLVRYTRHHNTWHANTSFTEEPCTRSLCLRAENIALVRVTQEDKYIYEFQY